MDGSFQQLISILSEQLVALSELRALLDREKDAIAAFDSDGLEVVAGNKLSFQNRVQELERRRLEVAGALAAQFGLNPETATLKELAEFAPESQQHVLNKARDVFRQLGDELGDKIGDNKKRIDRSLWLIKNLRGLITEQIEEPPTYEELARGPIRGGSTSSGGGRV